MIDELQRLGRHGEWADARLLKAARQASGDLAVVLRELGHVRAAQEIWLSRIDGRAATLPVWPTLGLDELAAAGASIDAAMGKTLGALTPEALTREIAYKTSAGVTYRTAVGDILLHVLTHGQYHRGKANAALRAIGAEAANVDFITWLRETARVQQS
ncbi:MAG: DinB family protein [Vicinamibacterales bacterium]